MSERIPASASEAAKRRVIAALRAGDVVVLPTDTVYAVVADAFNPSAMDKLRKTKGRTKRRPFSVVIRSPRQVTGLVSDIPDSADRLMAAYWPGPLTLMFSASDGLGWSLGETQGTVGLRMPTDDLLLSIIAEVGPLACTAASKRGASPATDVDQAEEQLRDGVALYVDGGRRDGRTSTIVDVTGTEPKVLREGAVPAAHVEKVCSGDLAWGERPAEVVEHADEPPPPTEDPPTEDRPPDDRPPDGPPADGPPADGSVDADGGGATGNEATS